MDQNSPKKNIKPKVVIIGGGFGGIQVAKALKNAPVDILLLDKHNYHTFQPLLYQVAMGAIAADSIAFPIRRIFTYQDNFSYHLAYVQQINAETNTLTTTVGDIHYDYLIVATGSNTNFFGNKEIENFAMPMKNVPEALNLRGLVLQHLEKATVATNAEERAALMTFVVVGGGPTGVELSGALAEMRRLILTKDYHGLSKDDMRVYLVEGKDRVLGGMSEQASQKAKQYLSAIDVMIYNSVHVQSYDGLELKIDDGMMIKTRNVFWAAGVMGEVPKGMEKATVLPRTSRIQVDEINKIKGYDNIFAIGDVASMSTADYPNGHPGVAPVAIQQGQWLGKNLMHIIKNEPTEPFKYKDKGTMATIGRNKAVADIGRLHFQGIFAWFLWGFVHIMTLAGFSSKLSVFLSWGIKYFTKNSDNRLIIRNFNVQTRAIDPEQ